MPRWDAAQESFNAGELSPRVYGRTDLEQYKAGAKSLLNMLILQQGGVMRRSGTRFVHEVKDSSDTTRLIPFIFSTEQAYILEFGDQYMRVYMDEGIVETAPDVPFELATSYLESEVRALRYAQSADTLYIVHEKHPPAKLTRTGHTSWSIDDVEFVDGPYLLENTTATTLTPSATTGAGITITASAVTGINNDQGFLAQDIGRLVRIELSDKWGYAEIVGITDTTHVTADVKGAFNSTSSNFQWQLGAWYVDNYPRAVTFNQGRLVVCGEPNTPDTIHASVSQLFERFHETGDPTGAYPLDKTVSDDNALNFTIGSGEVNAILWAKALRNLILGTSGGAFEMRASTIGEAVTPTNVNVPESTVNGTSDVDPVKVGSGLIYMGKAGRRARNLAFSFTDDSFVSSDLTLLANHITESGVIELSYAEESDGWVGAVREDGIFLTGVVVPEQRVVGWARNQIGGSFGTGHAKVVSVATIPSPDADHDAFWMIVQRTIDGVTTQYVEFMEEPFRVIDADQDIEDAFFVDSGITGTAGSPTDTWSGLDHLEGETVAVLADGATEPTVVVSGGAITLQRAVSKVQVGLPFTSDLELLRPNPPDPLGSSQGKNLRRTRVLVLFNESLGGKVGPDEAGLDPIPFRDSLDPMDSPPPVFSGYVSIPLEAGWGRDGGLLFRQDQPHPFGILSVTTLGEGGER